MKYVMAWDEMDEEARCVEFNRSKEFASMEEAENFWAELKAHNGNFVRNHEIVPMEEFHGRNHKYVCGKNREE